MSEDTELIPLAIDDIRVQQILAKNMTCFICDKKPVFYETNHLDAEGVCTTYLCEDCGKEEILHVKFAVRFSDVMMCRACKNVVVAANITFTKLG